MCDNFSCNVKHQICASAISQVQVCPFLAFIKDMKVCVQADRNNLRFIYIT
jgi:hypothetical protein